MADHLTGRLVGNYRLVRFLGRGSFADVYLGEHIYLRSSAALKILSFSLQEEEIERFLVEGQTLVRLRHANIMRVLEFAFEGRTPVLVMDYAAGGTARQRYPEGSQLPLSVTVAFVKQVAAALQYAHTHNFIHRDVKPENILFDADQQILLSDFGLALFAPSPELMSTQELAGTPSYIAPEQLQGKPGFASDQYALGIVTYEWLCGKRPFGGAHWALMQQHMLMPPPPLRQHRPDIPAAVEAVVLKALAKKPEQRYPGVEAFALALERASQQTIIEEEEEEITVPLKALSSSVMSAVAAQDTVAEAGRLLSPAREAIAEQVTVGQILLTCASADDKFAARLQADLEAGGIRIASVRQALAPESPNALQQAMRAARVVLVVVSPATRSSWSIKEQLRIASMYQQHLVFVWVQGDEMAAVLPETWGRTALIDLIDAREARYPVALREIKALLEQHLPGHTERTALLLAQGEPRNPYKGLRAFHIDDAADFFGRDGLIEDMAETLEQTLRAEKLAAPGSRLLAVIGPSGSGKSSVVMAGLLPRLQRGALPGSEDWVYLEPMVPAEHPFESLARTLAPHLPQWNAHAILQALQDDSVRGLHLLATRIVRRQGSKVVLTIDQLEELFTRTLSEQERSRFIDLLVAAVTEPGGPLILLLTLRADFYDRPMQYPRLSPLLEARQKAVLPMNPHELRAVIERPAVLPDVQLLFEENLVGDLLFEAQGQPGALPLLEFTLDQLFQQREGHWLTRNAYLRVGGVKGALAKHAESTYAGLPSDKHRQLARSLFLRLIDPGASEQDTTRRRTPLSELSLLDPRESVLIRQVASAFVSAHLLTTNEVNGVVTIEVSHEALIRHWGRLAIWLHETREDIILQQAISADAVDWKRRGQPVERLYRGAQLVEAQAWAERNVANVDEVAFLQASAIERQSQQQVELDRKIREVSLQRRVVSRQRLLIAALSIFSVIVVVLASLAQYNAIQVGLQQAKTEHEKQLAEFQRRVALSRALAAEAGFSLSQEQLDRALLLSLEAYNAYPTYEARNSLFNALEQSPQIVSMLRSGRPDYLSTLAFGSNGQVFIASDRHRIYMWNTAMRQAPLYHLDNSGDIGGVALSRDNRTVAIASAAGVWLWDIQTGKELAQLDGRISTPPGGLEPSVAVAFSPDGQFVEAARCKQYQTTQSGYLCVSTQVSAWNVLSKQLSGSPYIIQANADNATFSSDGQLLAAGTTSGIQVWNVATGNPLPSPFVAVNDAVTDIVFSQDNKLVAASGSDKANIYLWNVATGNSVPGSPLVGHSDLITDLAFSPDGRKLASSSIDKTVRVWDITQGKSILTLTGDPQIKRSVAFGPDGTTLLSGSDDGTILLWNISADNTIDQQLATTPVSHSNPVFSPDGTLIYAGSDDGRVLLYNAKTGQASGSFDTSSYPLIQPKIPVQTDLRPIESLALSGDGSLLAAGRADGTIVLWDSRTGKSVAHFVQQDLLYQLFLSSDGKVLVSAGTGNNISITVWDVAKSKPLHIFSYPEKQQLSTLPLALSPGGKLLAVGSCAKLDRYGNCQQGQAQLLDVATGKAFRQPFFLQQYGILGLAFNPAGTILAASSQGGIIFWNVALPRLPGTIPSLPSDGFDYYSNILFSPDGKTLASYSGPGSRFSFVLWDVVQLEAHTQAFVVANTYLGSVAFSPNLRQLASISANQSMPDQAILRLWDISIASWQEHACAIANRNLTRDEWKEFVVGETYRKVCPQLP